MAEVPTTNALQRLISAKQGKDVAAVAPSTGPAREESSLAKLITQGGQQEVVAAQEKGAQAQQEINLQQKAQEQQVVQQGRQLNEQALNIKSQFQEKITSLLSDLEQRRSDLTLGKDKAKAEQAAFLYRLSSDQYMNKLKSEGQRSRLDSDIKFKDYMMDAIFSNKKELAQTNIDSSTHLLEDDLLFRSLLSADDRVFSTKLNKMGIDQAWKVAMQEMDATNQEFSQGQEFAATAFSQGLSDWEKELDMAAQQANETAIFSGLSTAVKAGAEAYDASQEKAATKKEVP